MYHKIIKSKDSKTQTMAKIHNLKIPQKLKEKEIFHR